MGAEIVQAQYDQLTQVASRFGKQSEVVDQINSQIRQSYDSLANGGWMGDAAKAFFNEMQSEIFPVMQRLTSVLREAQTVTQQISSVFQQAEQEASKVITFGDGGASAGNGSTSFSAAAQGFAAGSAAGNQLPPPRMYIVNGINATEADGTPGGGPQELARLLAANGYDPSQVKAMPAIYNTNYVTDLKGTDLKGTNHGGLLSPVDWLTGLGAGAINKVTGAGAGLINGGSQLFNTVVGVSEVVQEYTMQDQGKYTQESYNFIKQDLARNPLLPGQSVMLLGHSGGGAVVSNLAPMLENNMGVDVSGVVTMGSPVANADRAMQHAKFLSISDKGDYIGQPWIRSDEGRNFITPGLMTGILAPKSLPLVVPGVLGADRGFRDPGINYFTTNANAGNPISNHNSYWTSNDVVSIIKNSYPEVAPYLK
ncbi:WXG100 family type VII secretion target [Herpetosiphon giganteus]|uniref:WXG100 family type VII secretion target n=1 Tax=Herpetosiphon giganteus TaxID=2029754 RepID=UPI00195D8862|nr:WXG100 family type VII secretion target [Herpetosiphon giganteus]MBM7843388.1 WXG100 family type VII secretion target [Herpetosiphon giganteus]